MNIRLLKKSCPTCKTSISFRFFANREEIIRCPKCSDLLIENPKRKVLGMIIFLAGLGLGLYLSISISYLIVGLITILISLLISFLLSNLIVIKRDLVIKNIQTNQTSYINNSDWDEILKNYKDKENSFEIIERLK